MVDGKGGNLKTIHHYKTERVFCYHTTFQIIFERVSGWKGRKPSTNLQSANSISATPASFGKEKGHALVPVFFPLPGFGRFFDFGLRNDSPRPFLILSQKKIMLMNPAGGNISISFLAAPRIILLFFSFHEIHQFSITITGEWFTNLFMAPSQSMSPPGCSPFYLIFSKSDANETALSACTISFWII